MVLQSYHNGGVVKRYLVPLLITGLLAAMRPWMMESSVAMISLLKQGMALELGIDKYFGEKASGKK
jgi:uncharacterized protein YbaP (TraB family)